VNRLHRHDRQRGGGEQREFARVRAEDLERQARAAARELARQRRVALERHHLVPVARKRQRDPACASARQ
jgi:hypothetical protein